MVSQGDIIKVSFNPQKGHEQAGYRPAVVISNDFFNQKTNLAILCLYFALFTQILQKTFAAFHNIAIGRLEITGVPRVCHLARSVRKG